MSSSTLAGAKSAGEPNKAKPPKKPLKPSNLRFARALFAYKADGNDELSFAEGDLLFVLEPEVAAPSTGDTQGWWRARLRGKEGLVPSNYLSCSEWSQDGSGACSNSPIHDACRRGNLDLLEECLLNKVPLNCPDRAGNTPAHWAAHSGNVDCLRRLLEVGGPLVKVTQTNRLGETPLHLAASRGHPEVVRALRQVVDPGAVEEYLHCRNNQGLTPWDLATDVETKAELVQWKASLLNNPSGRAQDATGDPGQSLPPKPSGLIRTLSYGYKAEDYHPSDNEDSSSDSEGGVNRVPAGGH